MKKILVGTILLALLTFKSFGQEIVTNANFQLANNWTVQKQFKRVQNIWTVPSWVNGTELFAYKHVKDGLYNYYLIDPQKKSKVELFNREKLCWLFETNLDTNLNWEKLNLSNIKISSTLSSIIFSYDNNDYEYNPTNNSLIRIERPNNLVNEELKVNPDIDAINSEGYTPLHLAVQRPDNEKAIAHLLQQGADVNIPDPTGRNALLVSVGSNQKEYIELLVSNGIDINSQDNDGNTALHYPLINVLKNKMYLPFSKEIAKIQLEEGADPQIRNKEGKSPTDLAVESGENELTNLLTDNKKTHYSYPWKVHEIAKDFELLDVWEFPIMADKTRNQDFSFFLKVVQQPPKQNARSFFSIRYLIARFLIFLRVYLGEMFGLDKNINSLPIPDSTESSIKERLSVEDQKRSLAESSNEGAQNQGIWRTVYLYENEMLTELSNDTVHALMHLGWVHKSGNYFTALFRFN